MDILQQFCKTYFETNAFIVSASHFLIVIFFPRFGALIGFSDVKQIFIILLEIFAKYSLKNSVIIRLSHA